MQQGQVFELKKRAVDGRAVWAYRYRTDGPGSRRLQRGGFSSERDAAEALERALELLRRQKGVVAASSARSWLALAIHSRSPVGRCREHWLDVDHGGSVDCLEGPHGEFAVCNVEHRDWMQSEGIRPVRRPCCEDARERSAGVSSRVRLQNVAAGLVQPSDDDELVADLDPIEAGSDRGRELDPRVGRSLGALVGCCVSVFERRADDADRVQLERVKVADRFATRHGET
jgi:hypothetical protein